jgi:hypothetical protein
MLMRRLCLWCLLLLIASIQGGCGSTVSTNATDYVGEYIFKPNDLALGEFANFVILRQDLSAVEVRYSKPTGAITSTQESWHLFRGTGEQVVIGKRAYPIDKSGSSIRLTINDVGQYYEKVR